MAVRTVAIAFEFLAAGAMIVVGMVYLIDPFVPQYLSAGMLEHAAEGPSLGLILLFASIAYAVGVAAEFLAQQMFEPLQKYHRGWLRIEWMKMSSIDETVVPDPQKKWEAPTRGRRADATRQLLGGPFGVLRFAVMADNKELYGEIESELNRLRILRLLFLSGLLFYFGGVVRLDPLNLWSWLSASASVLVLVGVSLLFLISHPDVYLTGAVRFLVPCLKTPKAILQSVGSSSLRNMYSVLITLPLLAFLSVFVLCAGLGTTIGPHHLGGSNLAAVATLLAALLIGVTFLASSKRFRRYLRSISRSSLVSNKAHLRHGWSVYRQTGAQRL